MKYISPYTMNEIVESSLRRNYEQIATLIEISGKYPLDPKDEKRILKQIRKRQFNILSIQKMLHRFQRNEKREA